MLKGRRNSRAEIRGNSEDLPTQGAVKSYLLLGAGGSGL
jgi:hypothetical protein